VRHLFRILCVVIPRAYRSRSARCGFEPNDPDITDAFNEHVEDSGYALLLKRYAPNVVDGTPA
jgi:hypothetical protein